MAQADSSEVIDALGQHLHALGLALYSPDDILVEDEALPAYVDGNLPPDPDTCVSAVVTRDNRDRGNANDPSIDVRLRFRSAVGASKTADQFGDDCFTALHVPDHAYRPQVWPGGVRVIDVRRVVRAKSFEDSNGRRVRADDYRITLAQKEI